ncbi:MAG: membrane dipeptidase [Anaerolineales bacterium]|nr:membrane dipeptidase [Anaerolineales bacterium]
MPLIVDAHQDLAWNALTFGRDVSRSVAATRAAEAGAEAATRNGHTLLGLPEYLAGQVAVIFGTLFVSPARHASALWDAQAYATPEQAHQLAGRQLDYYHRLADEHPEFVLIENRARLEKVLATWNGPYKAGRRIGVVPLMEGADPIRVPEEVEAWYARGIRILGLAWAATRYAGGTGEPGPLTNDGRRLLELMAAVGMILDVSHCSDEACLEALDRYPGVVIASHANPRALLKDFGRPERMLTDAMIERLAEAGGVVGIVPYNRFLRADWTPAAGKDAVTLDAVVAMIDHVCQLTGSAAHVGIGSDFDGGFGVERVPAEIDTVADLQKLDPALRARGYSPADVAAILGGNWISVLRRGLPA